MFKNYIQKRLHKYVKRFFEKHPDVKLIVVTGSVGKTSTKRAIATMLSQRYRVAYHQGNHNTLISAPLSILGIEYPKNIRNPLAWLSVFKAARMRVKLPSGTDFIIQELGTDHPGEIIQFAKFIQPDIAVVTGVTPEHMENFKDIDAVATEELSVARFSKQLFINRDDIDPRYDALIANKPHATYGIRGDATYRFEVHEQSMDSGYRGELIAPELASSHPIVNVEVLGEHSLRSVMAAVAVGVRLNMTPAEIVQGVGAIRPVPGRMNALKGIGGTTIIDDSYNNSPAAAVAAIQTLYSQVTPQRVLVFGDMNELGEVSAEEHSNIGKMCDPSLLSWVVTVGPEAEKYVASNARDRGCQVRSFASAIEAGGFVRSILEPGAVVLVKGSQGGIYTEEAVKVLVYMSEGVELVRQEPEWMKVKDSFFSKF